MYDETTGRRLLRGGQPIARPRQAPTPCWKCPKQSPRVAPSLELSPKNQRAFEFYWRVRASQGSAITPAMRADARLCKNLALIDQVVRGSERRWLFEALQRLLKR